VPVEDATLDDPVLEQRLPAGQEVPGALLNLADEAVVQQVPPEGAQVLEVSQPPNAREMRLFSGFSGACSDLLVVYGG
jgi:hypothetical protein